MNHFKSGLFLAAILGCLSACATSTHTVYRDANIVAIEKLPPFALVNVHGAKTISIKVNGHTYDRVQGVPPFYLDVPDSNLILFVTHDHRDNSTFHFYDKGSKKITSLAAGQSSFGGHIGAAVKNGDVGSDFIEKVRDGRLWLSKRSVGWMEMTLVNLNTGRIENVKTIIYDADGTIKSSVTRTNSFGP